MSEMAAFMALIETASAEGILTLRRYLKEHSPHEMWWSYDNILGVVRSLMRHPVSFSLSIRRSEWIP